MLRLRPVYPDVQAVQKAMAVFRQYPNTTVEYGNYTVNTDRMALECDLILTALHSLDAAAKDETMQNGQALIAIGNRYVSEIGDDNLVLENVFKQTTISGRNYALILLAEGYETLADAIKWDDPKKAAEYQQQAMFYNKDREDAEAVARNEEFIRGVAKTVHCWFCGKEVCGENIHFVPMPARLTDPILAQTDKDNPIPTCDNRFVYTCRACYSSIDNNGYKHYRNACEYTDKEINALKAYTDQQLSRVFDHIDDLQKQINNIVNALNRR